MPDLVIIPGDGIGQEVIPAAVQVLQAVVPRLVLIPAEAGWECFQKYGVSVLEETLSAVRFCHAALFGAVSSPSQRVPGYRSAILTLRQSLDLYANLRPVCSLPHLSTRPGLNLLIVRENTEGLYAGRERLEEDTAVAERVITRRASLRIGRAAARLALQTGRRLTIVHKANILPISDGLFRDSVLEAVREVTPPGQSLETNELLVDSAALKLASEPESFDVIVTTNLFGDILSDLASVHCGGLGLAPSLNLGDACALAEPVHGSAPDIAGKGIANPIAAILSAALLLHHTWNMPAAAQAVEDAVRAALAVDLPIQNSRIQPGFPTAGITRAILKRLDHPLTEKLIREGGTVR